MFQTNFSVNSFNTRRFALNFLSANPTKWSNTLKQFVGKLSTNCLSVIDHFVELALKGLNYLRYFLFQVWNMVQLEFTNLNDVEIFRSEIRI